MTVTWEIYLSPLQIKRQLIKTFVKALYSEGNSFPYLIKKTNKIENDGNFRNTLSEKENRLWTAFKSLASDFLCNRKSENYTDLVEERIKSHKTLTTYFRSRSILKKYAEIQIHRCTKMN